MMDRHPIEKAKEVKGLLYSVLTCVVITTFNTEHVRSIPEEEYVQNVGKVFFKTLTGMTM